MSMKEIQDGGLKKYKQLNGGKSNVEEEALVEERIIGEPWTDSDSGEDLDL